jgi:competence protein ComGF
MKNVGSVKKEVIFHCFAFICLSLYSSSRGAITAAMLICQPRKHARTNTQDPFQLFEEDVRTTYKNISHSTRHSLDKASPHIVFISLDKQIVVSFTSQ